MLYLDEASSHLHGHVNTHQSADGRGDQQSKRPCDRMIEERHFLDLDVIRAAFDTLLL